MELTEHKKKEIDNMNQTELLRKIRFAPLGDPDFQGKVGDYILKRSRKLQDDDPKGHIAASKEIGW